jgi:hypothetical protein
MPRLDDILGGRILAMESDDAAMTEEGKYAYFFFCNTVLECVAGKKEWKKEKSKLLVSKSSVTVSDEAFALLLLVNSWDKFEHIAERPDATDKSDLPATRFTEKKGRNKRMQGWSQEGIKRYNLLCEYVKQDRESAAGMLFEAEFLKYHQDEMVRKKACLSSDGNEGDDDDEEMIETPMHQAFNQMKELSEMVDDNDGGAEMV